MIFVHQITRVVPGAEDRFDALLRERWLPAVAEIDGARLAWCATATAANRWSHEVAMVTALRDAAGLDGFASACRSGALRPIADELGALRRSVETRLLRPIDYDPWALDFDAIPAEPTDGPVTAYMHDFVPPVRGQMRAYIDMMRERYMALSQQALSGIVLRASWQTVAGGGPVPEMFNLSEIRDVEALANLLAYEIPKEHKQMGTWMWEALATRDRWTTRLLRSTSWSPVR